MLKAYFLALLLMFTVANVAACTSHPDDKGDVSGRDEYRRNN